MAYPEVSKSVDDSVVPTVSPFFILPHMPFLTVQGDPSHCLQKWLTCLVAYRVCPCLTCQPNIALQHIHPSLCSPTWTGWPCSEQLPNRHTMTHLSTQTPQGIGALRHHRQLSKHLLKSHPTRRLWIFCQSHNPLLLWILWLLSVTLCNFLQHHSNRVQLQQAWRRLLVRHHSDKERRTRQMMLILSSACNRFSQMQNPPSCIATLSRLGRGKPIMIFVCDFKSCFTHSLCWCSLLGFYLGLWLMYLLPTKVEPIPQLWSSRLTLMSNWGILS